MTTDAGIPGVPQFDVVLRGYDRRQVDEHVARLQRVLARMRADVELARSQPQPVVPSPATGLPSASRQTPPGGRPRPTPRPRPAEPPGESPDMIGDFTDRMQTILQSAEEEAVEIRKGARADADAARAELVDLGQQRDAMLAELTRMRARLEALLTAPTGLGTISSPPASSKDPQPAVGPQAAQASNEPRQNVNRGIGAVQAAGGAAPGSRDESSSVTPPVGSSPSRAVRTGGDVEPSLGRPSVGWPPAGAYPAVVGDEPASMRPRTEPEPEPAELFRSASPQVPLAARLGVAAMRGPETGDVAATVEVGAAVRPSAPSDASAG